MQPIQYYKTMAPHVSRVDYTKLQSAYNGGDKEVIDDFLDRSTLAGSIAYVGVIEDQTYESVEAAISVVDAVGTFNLSAPGRFQRVLVDKVFDLVEDLKA